MDERYIFRVTAYDNQLLMPQVSKALELRTDLLSRVQYPVLWSATDKLHSLSKGKSRSKTRSIIMGVLELALGLFLFIPGLLKPEELTGPLLIGAIGIIAGIINLRSIKKTKQNPFEQAAASFLADKADLNAEQGIEVRFDDFGAEFVSLGSQPEFISYENFECAIEGPDLFLFVFDARITVMQKCDLAVGDSEKFWKFVTQKVSTNISFI